jgi:hypothetical protein
MKIVVEIDRLVLEGIPVNGAQSGIVRAAVEREMARLLAVHGMPPQWRLGGSAPRLSGPAVRIPDKPAAIGTHIAAAVHASLAFDGGSHE